MPFHTYHSPLRILYNNCKINEPVHDKTYNKTSVTSKDLDQSVHPRSMARVLIHPSSDSPKAIKGTCDQRRF